MTTAARIEELRLQVEEAKTKRARLEERRETLRERVRSVKAELEEYGVNANDLPRLIVEMEQSIEEMAAQLEAKLNGGNKTNSPQEISTS